MAKTTIIVGGGLAGLAAAAALAQRNVSVTLLESRPRLGGRASSFIDRETGTCIDNCQHVSMGCCTNFRHFCDTVGLSDLFRREPELYFIGRDGVVNRLTASRLPSPFHLWPSLRKVSYLNRRDRSLLAQGLRELVKSHPSHGNDQTFAEWLRQHRQTSAAIERFWSVVLVSALSETLDRIAVSAARKVFVDGFLANREGWQVLIPAVPLDELYGSRLTEWLTRRGVTVRLQSGVKRLVIDENVATAVELRSGERLRADDFIVAVPHHLVPALLPESLRAHPQFVGIMELEYAPISSVHLWFDRPITSLPHAVLIGRLSQWMFNRTILQRDLPDDRLFYYQIVISAGRHLVGRSQQQTIGEVVRDLAEVWPNTAGAKRVHSRLVTEHKAVFSVKPGAEELRPTGQSPISNLQLAGDWTRTGWPATMEGAVRSGYRAAENVLARHGREEKLLQPDLPIGLLSRLLLGL